MATPDSRIASIEKELTPERLVRHFRGLDIYTFHGDEAPCTMDEVGRIRELEFRRDGGGTGKPLDIDEYDRGGFRQLVAWDAENRELVAMYRYGFCRDLVDGDGYKTPTASLFEFSDEFRSRYLTGVCELGRSVVHRGATRALRGLHAIWGGLGAIVIEHPEIDYFFGKFTMYPQFDREARNAVFTFLHTWFDYGSDELVIPRDEFALGYEHQEGMFAREDYRSEWNTLIGIVASRGEAIPPLVVSYTGLSKAMRVFGTVRNPHFGNVEETAILMPVKQLEPKVMTTFIDSHVKGSSAPLWSPDYIATPGRCE